MTLFKRVFALDKILTRNVVSNCAVIRMQGCKSTTDKVFRQAKPSNVCYLQTSTFQLCVTHLWYTAQYAATQWHFRNSDKFLAWNLHSVEMCFCNIGLKEVNLNSFILTIIFIDRNFRRTMKPSKRGLWTLIAVSRPFFVWPSKIAQD